MFLHCNLSDSVWHNFIFESDFSKNWQIMLVRQVFWQLILYNSDETLFGPTYFFVEGLILINSFCQKDWAKRKTSDLNCLPSMSQLYLCIYLNLFNILNNCSFPNKAVMTSAECLSREAVTSWKRVDNSELKPSLLMEFSFIFYSFESLTSHLMGACLCCDFNWMNQN